MNVGAEVFVSYPSAVMYKVKGAATAIKGKTPLNQLLWGDWARITGKNGKWYQVRSRRRTGWVREENLQEDRILEVNFVDIGQGDGCHVQTPQDESIIIDAGEGDNMYRFLRWRFGKFSKRYDFESFIISHPDKDHYYGFTDLIAEPNVFVGTIFHNTIVEQKTAGRSTLGAETKVGRKKYLTGLVRTLGDLRKITDRPAKVGGRQFPTLMRDAISSGCVGDIVGLLASTDWRAPEYLPGYGPADNRGMTLRILGPVPQELGGGKLGLPRMGSVGETKNGHSVVLLLEIGKVRMLLGGDLNDLSQRYLLEHYTGLDPRPRTPSEMEALVAEGRKHFEVDIAKACHHGSPHVEPSFLQSTNPLVTVISSGDDEPHCHPRPDTLGIIGKFARSDRPLIFSTELARSSKETIKHPNQVRSELRRDIEAQMAIRDDDNSTAAQKDRAEAKLDDLYMIIQRSVASYGMINVRTDGTNVLIAQKLERKRSKAKRWDIHLLEPDSRGRLHYEH